MRSFDYKLRIFPAILGIIVFAIALASHNRHGFELPLGIVCLLVGLATFATAIPWPRRSGRSGRPGRTNQQ